MTDPAEAPEGMELRLAVRPPEPRMRERRKLLVDLVVTNHGSTPIDPSLDDARLSVNGEDSVYFALAMSNGVRDRSLRLAPSDTLTTTWPGMGRILFPRPGEYTLVLTLGTLAAPPVLVRVTR